MGGAWERLIRTIRRVMLAVLDNTRLTDEILETVFCEIENIVNSRPLTKLSDDGNIDALTPNQLLILKKGHPILPGKFSEGDQYRARWRHVQHLSSQFWRKWLKLYLPELHRRHKWSVSRDNLKSGDLVRIADENTDRGLWPLAVVKNVNLSRDGKVRSARVKSKSSEFVRPITKLVLLEAS